jgi:hypothetical protein
MQMREAIGLLVLLAGAAILAKDLPDPIKRIANEGIARDKLETNLA